MARTTQTAAWGVALALLFGTGTAWAASADDSPEAWRAPRALDGLYDRVAEDLRAGAPLTVSVHAGLWPVRADEPERNLNWGTRYGHWRMLERVHRGRVTHVRKQYRFARWRRVFEMPHPASGDLDEASGGLVRLLVYRQVVRPNAFWRERGVTEPFVQYLALHAWGTCSGAAAASVRALRSGVGQTVTLEDGTQLDLGAAQAVGYMGHNPFYDYADFDWDGLRSISGQPERPRGFFAVGCNTARVPGFPAVVGPNVHVLLMSRSLMAVGGYITLALADSLARGHSSRAMVRHADRTYYYFHRLHKPHARIGRPFVGHDFRMYPIPTMP